MTLFHTLVQIFFYCLNFIKYPLRVDAALEWGLIGKFRLIKIEKIITVLYIHKKAYLFSL